MNNFSIITTPSVLSEADYVKLFDCKQFIIDNHLTTPMYRSLPIKLFGVLSNKEFPTPESKYWQCKVEAEVHANELIRELHDLEDMKINAEKIQFVINQMNESPITPDKNFDYRKLQVALSRQKFEMMQLEKKIKYRIEEVVEWKKISEKLTTNFNIKTHSYAHMLTYALEEKWTKELQNPTLADKEKADIMFRLQTLKETVQVAKQTGIA